MRWFHSLRLSFTTLLFVLLTIPQPTHAYSVLAHEQLIDLAWVGSVQPFYFAGTPTLLRPISARHVPMPTVDASSRTSATILR
jgi:hypothetical protein